MAHTLDPGTPIGAELARVLLLSLDQAKRELSSGPTEPAVHKARKAGKRARAAADLAEDSLEDGAGKRLDRAIRDAARHLSELRDADVMRGWVNELGLDIQVHEVADREACAREAVHGLEAAAEIARGLSFDPVDATAVIRSVQRTWSRTRRAFRDARRERTPESLHEWRKGTKRLMYQMELVSDRYPEVAPVVKLLDGLQEELGTHHDLSVLHGFSPDPDLQRRADAMTPHLFATGSWVLKGSGRAFGRWLTTRPD